MSNVSYNKCDHCGVILDAMADYGGIDIEMCHKLKTVDLCTDCFEKLWCIIDEFTEAEKALKERD